MNKKIWRKYPTSKAIFPNLFQFLTIIIVIIINHYSNFYLHKLSEFFYNWNDYSKRNEMKFDSLFVYNIFLVSIMFLLIILFSIFSNLIFLFLIFSGSIISSRISVNFSLVHYFTFLFVQNVSQLFEQNF